MIFNQKNERKLECNDCDVVIAPFEFHQDAEEYAEENGWIGETTCGECAKK